MRNLVRFPVLIAAVVASVATMPLEQPVPSDEPAPENGLSASSTALPVSPTEPGALRVEVRLEPGAWGTSTGSWLTVDVVHTTPSPTGELAVTLGDAMGPLESANVLMQPSGETSVALVLDDAFPNCLPAAGSDWCYASYELDVVPSSGSGEIEVFVDLEVDGLADPGLASVSILTL